jgi:Cobalamin-independent synthase, Catalytic domain
MKASSAPRSARAGRAAKAFRGFKYPNEIGPGVHDIQSPRMPALDEMHHLSPLRGMNSMTRRSGSARTLMQLVRQNPRLDPNVKFFGSCDTILGPLYKTMHKCELVVRHLTKGKLIMLQFGRSPRLAKIEPALAGLAEAYARLRLSAQAQASHGYKWTNPQLRCQGCDPR